MSSVELSVVAGGYVGVAVTSAGGWMVGTVEIFLNSQLVAPNLRNSYGATLGLVSVTTSAFCEYSSSHTSLSEYGVLTRNGLPPSITNWPCVATYITLLPNTSTKVWSDAKRKGIKRKRPVPKSRMNLNPERFLSEPLGCTKKFFSVAAPAPTSWSSKRPNKLGLTSPPMKLFCITLTLIAAP